MANRPFPSRFQGTAAARFYQGLRPSMGSEQPAPPWAGLLLDRTCPLPSRTPLKLGMGQNELICGGEGSCPAEDREGSETRFLRIGRAGKRGIRPAWIWTIKYGNDVSTGGPTGSATPLNVGQARGAMWIRLVLWAAARRLADWSRRHLGQPKLITRGEPRHRDHRRVPACGKNATGVTRRYV